MNQRLGRRKRLLAQQNQEPKAAGDTADPAAKKEVRAANPNPKTTASIGGKDHTVEPPSERRKRENEDKHWWHYLPHVAAIGGLLAAIGGVIAGTAGIYQGRVARDAEKISNRAFVISNAIQMITYAKPSDTGRPWQYGPIIENVGNTPTKNLRYASSGALCSSDMSAKTVDRIHIWRKRERTQWVLRDALIGPKSEIIGGRELVLTDSQIACQIPILAFGVIQYRDIFGQPHLVEFCYGVTPGFVDLKSYPMGQRIRLQGAPCETHNCQDDECGSDWEERATTEP
jgi:hypothetical protein